MTTRALLTLGLGQCVNWGVLYYAFAVLVLPLEADLQASRWAVTGAFSLALLVSAMLGPWVGARIDRGDGARVMRVGGVAGALALLAWAMLPGVVSLYVAWACLGVSMAMTLYEPAFALVSRAYHEPGRRLRALALITVCGGLASTVFLPLTATLLAAWGWRVTVAVLALLMAASTWAVDRTVFGSGSAGATPTQPSGAWTTPPNEERSVTVSLAPILGLFGFAAFAGAAIVAHLVPAMAERGVSPSTAAWVGGLFGLMQLPGRALMLRGTLTAAPWALLSTSLGLQAAGLATWALAPDVGLVVLGLCVFATGSGLATIVRPFLLQELYGAARIGYLNGRLSRVQQLARAAGPVLLAILYGVVSYQVLLLALGATFVLLTLAVFRQHRLSVATA